MLSGRVAPAQNEAPSAQASIDGGNALQVLQVAQMLVVLESRRFCHVAAGLGVMQGAENTWVGTGWVAVGGVSAQ